jgi:hypothetical protein
MATDNKGVMVYLPSDLEEVLEKYCTENKITRKNKDGDPMPSMGTGIVHYLRSHLLGEVPSNTPNGFTLNDVRSLIDQAIKTDSPQWDELKGEVDHLRGCLKNMATTDYIERALEPVMVLIDTQAQDLLSIHTQLAEVKNDCDLTTEGIQRLIADAISKVSIDQKTAATKETKQPKTPPTTKKTQAVSTGEISPDVLVTVKRLKANPQLLKDVTEGVSQGLVGKGLGLFLAQRGFTNKIGEALDPATLSRLKKAVEHINSGVQADGQQ